MIITVPEPAIKTVNTRRAKPRYRVPSTPPLLKPNRDQGMSHKNSYVFTRTRFTILMCNQHCSLLRRIKIMLLW